ncbi:hypothetical protein K8R43_00595 [archaeon]|nr:hypothetical protein [archaeon]
MEDKQFKELMRKLEQILRVNALNVGKDRTKTERILMLDKVGFTPKEISEIIGTTSNTVSVTLSQTKKRRLKK